MTLSVTFKWDYSPEDFFEGGGQKSFKGFPITIEKGYILAVVDRDLFLAEPDIGNQIESFLHSLFDGVQIHSHREFKIGSMVSIEEKPDGTEVKKAFLKASLTISGEMKGDLQLVDAQGNVIQDTKNERIQRQHEWADKIASAPKNDEILNGILASYKAAVADPGDEFTHLYEIRDALRTKFGTINNACNSLGINRAEWDVFDKITNDNQLSQSRHRGRRTGKIRMATEAELLNVRGFARMMIELYIDYIVPPST